MSLDTSNMCQVKTSSFESWIKTKPYWEKYLWWLHMTKSELTDIDIQDCYRYLLEDFNIIKTTGTRNDILLPEYNLDGSENVPDEIKIDKIQNLKNINAIDSECCIEFGKNLTIIYGDNGSGKSGIGRLFSNACFSRKPRKLLPDARQKNDATTSASADFSISDQKGSRTVTYTHGQESPILKSFSVFDQECAATHLNNENPIEFVPSKIKIFDEVFKSLILLEKKLQEEFLLKKEENPTIGLFVGDSPIFGILSSISCNTDEKKLDQLLTFTKEDEIQLTEKNKELTIAIKTDISAKKKNLQTECVDLKEFNDLLANKIKIISEDKAKEINKTIKDIKDKKEIVVKLGAKDFNFPAFKNIGSQEWKSLILAAQKLYEKELSMDNKQSQEYCPLCRQSLNQKEKTLFSDYWDFLNSTAESELKTAEYLLDKQTGELEREINNWPSFSNTAAAVRIMTKDSNDSLIKIMDQFSEFKKQVDSWISNIKNLSDVSYCDPKVELNLISQLIDKKNNEESNLVDTKPIIDDLKKEILFLEDKKKASILLPKIKTYIKWLCWEHSAKNINFSNIKGNLTRKKTEVMGEMVVSKYVEVFNKETKKLDCGFGLLVESHGKDACTVKGLKLDFARRFNPTDILSEGEQTVSALADFLTESQLNKSNFGLIFDDPVTSLDHLRKTTIVERLVEESKHKQVIILTHDIGFLQELQSQAKRESTEKEPIETICLTLEKNGSKIGVVRKKLPWNVQGVNERINTLKSHLPSMKIAESGDQDEYRSKVKMWYGKLYETWEAAIEEKILKEAIVRYTNVVHPQALAKINLSDEIKRMIDNGMTEASNWRHDQGSAVNRQLPDNTKLSKSIEIIENCISQAK